jgi:flagellar biosynthetic protein FliP
MTPGWSILAARLRRTGSRLVCLGLVFAALWLAPTVALAQTTAVAPAAPALAGAPAVNATPFRLNIGLEGTSQTGEVSVAVQIVIVMTLLSVAPSIVLLMTSFTRIVIVLGFVRTALGTPSAPSNQIIVGLSLFLTFFSWGRSWTG